MKRFIILLSFLLSIGLVSAVTISDTGNIRNYGNKIGFKNAGTIQAADLYATDDAKVGDDMQVVGDLTVTGALAYGSGNFSSGTYDDDLRLLANHSFYSTAGSGAIDWSNATGIFKTPTGTNTLSGNVAIAGSKTFATGTGAVGINGDVTIAATKGITKTTGAGNFDFSAGTGFFNTTTGTNYINGAVVMASAKSITQAGASGITVGTTGITAASSPLNVLENLTLASGKSLAMSGASSLTTGTGTTDVNGAMTTENITMTQNKRLVFNTAATGYISWLDSGNYMTIKGNPQMDDGFTWAGVASPASGSDLNAIGGASDINYTLSSGILVTPTGAATHQGTTTFSKTVNLAVNASTTVGTTLTSSSTKTVYGVDASSANVTLTLPDAATVSGRTYMIGTNVDPGSNYVKVTATGSDKIGGAGGYTIMQTTDAKAGITVVSDGTRYLLVGLFGTWAEGTA